METLRRAGASEVTSLPPMMIVPEVTISSPAIKRNVVDLPQPDGPSSAASCSGPHDEAHPGDCGIRTPSLADGPQFDFGQDAPPIPFGLKVCAVEQRMQAVQLVDDARRATNNLDLTGQSAPAAAGVMANFEIGTLDASRTVAGWRGGSRGQRVVGGKGFEPGFGDPPVRDPHLEGSRALPARRTLANTEIAQRRRRPWQQTSWCADLYICRCLRLLARAMADALPAAALDERCKDADGDLVDINIANRQYSVWSVQEGSTCNSRRFIVELRGHG